MAHSTDPGETITITTAAWLATAQLACDAAGHWRGGSKWLVREVRDLDPAFAHRWLAAHGDPRAVAALAREVLARAGGPLFDGYRVTGDSPAKIGIVVRPERAEDCETVAAAHVAAWRAGYAHILPGEFLDGLDAAVWAQRRRQRFDHPTVGEVTLVADLDGKVVGHITFGMCRTQPDLSVGEIWACYVHPDHWGNGVGGELLRTALAVMPYPQVQLWVLRDNHRARGFYEHHEFRPDGAVAQHQLNGLEDEFPKLRLTLHGTAS